MKLNAKEELNKLGLYDFDSAISAGLQADSTQHWPSRVPSGENEGLLLKAPTHPTFNKTLKGDRELGYRVYQKNGRLYSFQNDRPGFKRVSDQELNMLMNGGRQKPNAREALNAV